MPLKNRRGNVSAICSRLKVLHRHPGAASASHGCMLHPTACICILHLHPAPFLHPAATSCFHIPHLHPAPVSRVCPWICTLHPTSCTTHPTSHVLEMHPAPGFLPPTSASQVLHLHPKPCIRTLNPASVSHILHHLSCICTLILPPHPAPASCAIPCPASAPQTLHLHPTSTSRLCSPVPLSGP